MASNSSWRWRGCPIIVVGAAVALLAVALFHGLRAAEGLDWHPGSDAYRDIALAQLILDGEYPGDYLIDGAWLWYNPLVGALVADPLFMNLYVPYEPRAQARETLWAALRAGDTSAFHETAAPYGVTHVLATAGQRDWIDTGETEGLRPVFSSAQYVIYSVEPTSGGEASALPELR